MRPIYKVLAPDEGTGGDGGGVEGAEGAPAPTEMPAPADVAPAPAAAAPQAEGFDYRAGFESLASRVEAWQKAQEAESTKLRDSLLRVFDPEGHQKRTAPQYVTREQVQQHFQQFQEQFETRNLVAQYQGELAAVHADMPDLFESLPGAEAIIRSEWAKSKTGESVRSIAKRIEGQVNKAFEARQAKYIAEKEKQAGATKGTLGKGTPGPAPKPNGEEMKGVRGFDRIRQALRLSAAKD